MFSVYAFEYNRFINFLLLNFFGCILRLTLEDIHIFMALLFLRLYRLRNARAQETTRLANIRACTKEQRVLCCSRCLCSDAWTVFGLLGPAVCWKLKHWTEEGNEMTLVLVCIHWGSSLRICSFKLSRYRHSCVPIQCLSFPLPLFQRCSDFYHMDMKQAD